MKQHLHCSIHQEDIELICNYKGCKQPYLCLLCFQEHKKICPANYKANIQRIHQHSRENQSWLEKCQESKQVIIAQIEALYQQKAQIHADNHQLATQQFTEIKQECQKHYSTWLQGIEGLESLFPHHIHIALLGGLEKKLDEIKKLDFSQANHVESVKDAKILEAFIASREAQHLQKIAQTLKAWTVCRNRLEGQKSAVIHLLSNMEAKEFFANSQQKPNEKNTKEIESLKAVHEVLLKSKNEAIQEMNLIKKEMQDLIQANKDLETQNAKLLAR